MCQSLFFKKRIWRRCFPVNFAKFLRTPFLQNSSGQLLLITEHSRTASSVLPLIRLLFSTKSKFSVISSQKFCTISLLISILPSLFYHRALKILVLFIQVFLLLANKMVPFLINQEYQHKNPFNFFWIFFPSLLCMWGRIAEKAWLIVFKHRQFNFRNKKNLISLSILRDNFLGTWPKPMTKRYLKSYVGGHKKSWVVQSNFSRGILNISNFI